MSRLKPLTLTWWGECSVTMLPLRAISQLLCFLQTRKLSLTLIFLIGQKLRNCGMTNGGVTVAEHSLNHVKVKDLSPVSPAAVLIARNKLCSWTRQNGMKLNLNSSISSKLWSDTRLQQTQQEPNRYLKLSLNWKWIHDLN